MYFEHSKFQFLRLMLWDFTVWRRTICVEDSLRFRIDDLDCDLGGCGACGTSYLCLVLKGVGHYRSKRFRKKTPFVCTISQFCLHHCWPDEIVSNEFHFQFRFSNQRFPCHSLVVIFKHLVSQHALAKRHFHKELREGLQLPVVLCSLVEQFLRRLDSKLLFKGSS